MRIVRHLNPTKWLRVIPLLAAVTLSGCIDMRESAAMLQDLQMSIQAFQERGIAGVTNINITGPNVTISVSDGLSEYPELEPIEPHRALVTLLETYARSDDILRANTVTVSGSQVGPVSVTSSRSAGSWRITELNFLRTGFIPGSPTTTPVGPRSIRVAFDGAFECAVEGSLELSSFMTGWLGSGSGIERCEGPDAPEQNSSVDLRIMRGTLDDREFTALVDLSITGEGQNATLCDGWGWCTCHLSGDVSTAGAATCRLGPNTVRGTWTMSEEPPVGLE